MKKPALILLLILPLSLLAVEGMWQPSELLELESDLKAKGLKIPVKNISDLNKHPMTALASLGFCSASFVSDQGLAITNHHCAYGMIQHNSSAENNLIDKGFYAKELKDELWGGPGSYIYVTENISDVSDQFMDEINSLSGQKRHEKIEEIKTSVIKDCETSEEIRCSVRNFHGGLQFYLIKQMQIKDVRLVYAPDDSIGKYGGDVDNWAWPRHTGDFTFLRAYVSKDGESAEYSEDNVPYQPKTWLTVNPDGVNAGDYTMVLGYPGRTNRHRLTQEIEFSRDWVYPTYMSYYKSVVDMIDKEAESRPEVGVAYASRKASINNYLKNSQGMLDGFGDTAIIEAKRQAEQTFANWSKEQQQSNVDSLKQLKEVVAQEQLLDRQHFDLSNIKSNAKMLNVANSLYRLAKEKEKPDHERNSTYQERNWSRLERTLKNLNQSFDKDMDQQFFLFALNGYASLPEAERFPELDQLFGIKGNKDDKKRLEKWTKDLYKKTKLDDADQRMKWFEKSAAEIEASRDPFLQLAVDMYEFNMREEKRTDAMDADLQEARMNYMKAYLDYAKAQNLPVYADANSTLRVTYGTVVGYEPKDGVSYKPFTTLEGIVEKNTGEAPFDSPQKQLDLIQAKDYGRHKMESLGSVPVNFLTDLDVTGGNSGSPTLDGNAELVGLVFDKNYESIVSDWIFSKDLTRAIHVDIRYILWVMEKIDNASRLLDEMNIK